MWTDLPKKQRLRYEKLISNFASLSEAFAQKAEDDESIVAPIVNSKFQETAFQESFNATGEDIANTSYDASIDRSREKDGKKYLVGIKTFGIDSGYQKIAQFKAISARNWNDIFDRISTNAKGCKTKEEVDKVNHDLYIELIENIADARNTRINSSKENLKGFKIDSIPIEAVYHVLMPTPKNKKPVISVGETSYTKIDVNNIHDVQCTSMRNPTNIKFSDGRHDYRYTSADSQLLMDFKNSDIVLDRWPIEYIEDAFGFFENMNDLVEPNGQSLVDKTIRDVEPSPDSILESHSWKLEVKPYSGFNAFYGQSKMSRKDYYRENWIDRIKIDFSNKVDASELDEVENLLKKILLNNWNTDEKKQEMVVIRKRLMIKVNEIGNDDLKNKIGKAVYRPADELEIRIPNSVQFHQKHPHFFTNNDLFINGTNSLVRDRKERTFKLMFLPSKDEIKAYINQQNGKSIESTSSQSILGKWILRDVFQLKKYEPLTEDKMNKLNINGVRFIKKIDRIEIEFIWIDSEKQPKDLWI